MDGRSRQNPAYRPAKERAPVPGRVLFLRFESRVRLLPVFALFAGFCAAPAQAASDGALLRRHSPVLRYDRAERDRATAVEALTPRVAGKATALNPRDRLPDRVY